jgi:serine/threonine-protein kinase
MLWVLKIGVYGVSLVLVAALSAYFSVRRSISGGDVQVPDLAEMTTAEAAAMLQASGLTLEEAAQRNDARVDAGRILAQDPLPGTDIKQQRKVKVVVSLGLKITAIPDLRGVVARKAQITLQQQGLRVGGQVYAYSRREEENLVMAQDPLPGSAGLGEGKVSLLISRGAPPRTFVMPELTGHSEADAVALLNRVGLKPGPVRRDPAQPAARGMVVAQSPEAGYPVRSGDLIMLTVGQGSEDGG